MEKYRFFLMEMSTYSRGDLSRGYYARSFALFAHSNNSPSFMIFNATNEVVREKYTFKV